MSTRPPDDDSRADRPAFAREPDRHELQEPPPYRFEVDRRTALKLVGAGLFVAVTVDATGQESGRRGGAAPDEAPDDIAAWIHVRGDGGVDVFTGKAELGQNIRTSLTQAVADEIRVPLDHVAMVMADTALTPFDMGTFGSRTTPTMAPQLRRAAAAARRALLDMAAARWSVDVRDLEAHDGRVVHRPSGREIGYGELTAGKDIVRPIGAAPPLIADRSGWRLAGTRHVKVNGRDFVTGRHQFPSDITRPGMLHGAIVRPPALGATLQDFSAAVLPPGTQAQLVRDAAFLGVVAPDVAAARKAAAAVTAQWSGPAQPATDRSLFDDLRRSGERRETVFESGSVATGRAAAASRVDGVYTADYIAHVPLEPRAAVAEWSGDGLTVWTGTQRPFGVRGELAEAFHLPVEKVRVIVPDTGSAYGGKHTGETAIEAARLARAAGHPVKVCWSRAEEFTWAYVRPAAVIDVQSGITADGRIAFWTFDTFNAGAAGIRSPYDVEHQRIAYLPANSPLRQGSYRGLAATANNFAREAHLDALARAAGADVVEFRLRHLGDARLKAVLQAAADRIGWGRAGDPCGIACGFEKGSYVGTAVRLSVERSSVKLRRIVCAFDCGAVVNPSGLENQVQGALVQGIGGALFEGIEFDEGRLTNAALAKYRVPRFGDVPPIEVVSIEPKGALSVGAGETPLIALAPAIAGAVFRATGRQVRRLPIERALVEAAQHA
jgi:nicotinate dehydrogenase subunit B